VEERSPKKVFISELNGVFAVLTGIKLLMTLVLTYWKAPVTAFLRLTGTERADGAVASLSSVSDLPGLLFGISLYLFCVSIPVFCAYIFRSEKKGEDSFFEKRPGVQQTFCAIGTTFLVAYVSTAVFYIVADRIFAILGYSFSPSVPQTPSSPALIQLYLIYLCVIPAVSEELLIRGLAMTTLKKCGKVFAVILSAAVFMMMHSSVSNYVFSLTAGLCIGYFSMRFDSLKLGIITHFFLNLNSAVLRLAEPYLNTFAGQIAYTLYFIGVAVFAVTFFIAFIVVFKIKRPGATAEKPEFHPYTVFRAPFFYVFFAVAAVSFYFDIISVFA
jgi:membrane protease YdiL (CAAX protease family)